MQKIAFLAVSLIIAAAGSALAEGDGNGPFGYPQNENSLPKGYLVGNAQVAGEQAMQQFFVTPSDQAAQFATAGGLSPSSSH